MEHTAPADVDQKHVFSRVVEYDGVFSSLTEIVRLSSITSYCQTECVLQEYI
jgi:hypothetical protein